MGREGGGRLTSEGILRFGNHLKATLLRCFSAVSAALREVYTRDRVANRGTLANISRVLKKKWATRGRFHESRNIYESVNIANPISRVRRRDRGIVQLNAR